MDVDVGMKVETNKTDENACKKKVGQGKGKGKSSRIVVIVIVVNEHRCDQVACVRPDPVVRYALGHSQIRDLLGGHRVRSRGDGRELLPSLNSIHANEIANGSVRASVVVRAMVNEVHGVDRDTLPGLGWRGVRCWVTLPQWRGCCRWSGEKGGRWSGMAVRGPSRPKTAEVTLSGKPLDVAHRE
jgi:hypothetical protein